jgi:hypothetical protein
MFTGSMDGKALSGALLPLASGDMDAICDFKLDGIAGLDDGGTGRGCGFLATGGALAADPDLTNGSGWAEPAVVSGATVVDPSGVTVIAPGPVAGGARGGAGGNESAGAAVP